MYKPPLDMKFFLDLTLAFLSFCKKVVNNVLISLNHYCGNLKGFAEMRKDNPGGMFILITSALPRNYKGIVILLLRSCFIVLETLKVQVCKTAAKTSLKNKSLHILNKLANSSLSA